MEMKELRRGAEWMTAGELRTYRRFVKSLEAHCTALGVAWTPLLGVRLRDIAVCHLLVLRVEDALLQEDAEAVDPKGALPSAVGEAIGKAQERSRKAMKELEEYCMKAGTPIDQGLADMMRPIIRQVAEMAYAAENVPEAADDSSEEAA